MRYYPIFLDVKDKDCLIVGGGPVGIRKALTLEKCGARVKVISDRFLQGTDDFSGTSIVFAEKKYEKKDIQEMFLVFAATNNPGLNREIKKDAAGFNILCNVADAPDNSDFLVPSVVDRGDLMVAVSTAGSSPAMAKKIRQDLERLFDPAYAKVLCLMGNIRKKLLSAGHAPDDHRQAFSNLIDRGILELVRTGDEININLILNEIFGKEYMYQELVPKRGIDE
ncbi:MAG: bifunctional precorrin-2 dehydrogenase/sirohydrochlorin ferrochelatase [Desulfobacula sp.]|jgi:precorrin-2 dehydrogenase/sirohydrochlorin ferrochelatase